jgi:predicted phage tail protein
MQLKKIKVYGKLRQFLGTSYFEAAVSSPAEAVRFLICNYPEVEKHMCEQYYKIKMNNFDVSLDFLSMKGKGDIQIIPVASGSGFIVPVIGGIFSAGAAVVSTAATAVTAVAGTALSVANTVAGAAVGTVATVANTAAGAVVAGAGAIANTAAGAVVAGAGAIASEVGTTGILGAIATTVATNVVVDGVTSLIAPTPEIAPPVETVDPIPQNDAVLPDQRAQNSFGFSAITNISRAGVAVPIIYGEVFTGSVVISAGIDTVQIEGTAE